MITKRIKIIVCLLVVLLCSFNFSFVLAASPSDVNQRIETTQEDIPNFSSPVCLLVGLNSSELSYQEVSALSGFELFSVPYRSDIRTLVEQINPTHVIIKHPSGFVGLYLPGGQLVRGVQTSLSNQNNIVSQGVPSSILQPVEANPVYDGLYYPGSLTGGVPHGGIAYTTPPKGRNLKRHFLKLASLLSLVPYEYPGYFKVFQYAHGPKNSLLFPYLVGSQVTPAIGAAASYADAKIDEAEYNDARTQPRDYKFQPVIEGY